MINSMTGFGRSETEDDRYRITVEIKAVNHRYLDENIKMPKKLYAFESLIRNIVAEYVSRGKVDVYITLENIGSAVGDVKYNRAIAAEYLEYLKQMKEEFSLEDDIRLSTLSRFPEVFTLEDREGDDEELKGLLEKTVRGAAEQFCDSRRREGENLKNDLCSKLDGMLKVVDKVEKRAPEVLKEYQDKLTAKVREMLADSQIDENRILMETAVYADKVCVDEEMVRLKSHIKQMKEELEKGGAVGRKLDFIAQEMNREANTTLSKSGDLEMTGAAIDLKTEIEKIREQVQNLE